MFLPLLLLCGALLRPDQTLIVLNKSDDTASLFAADSGELLATLPTGGGPHEVAVSPDGRTAVVANYGSARNGSWVNGNSLTVIDVASGRVTASIDLQLNEQPHGLHYLPDGERLLVTAESRGAVLVVDVPSGRVLRTIPTEAMGTHMVLASPDGRRAYSANIGSGSVSVLDVDEGRLLASIPTGAECEGIAITPDGTQVWTTNRQANTVTVIDTETLEVVAELPCASFPIRIVITPDGARALVSNAVSSQLVVIDVATRTVISRLAISADVVDQAGERLFGAAMEGSPTPIGVLVTPDGSRAFVAAANADRVLEIDLATLQVVRGLPTGREPDGLGWSQVEVQRADPSDIEPSTETPEPATPAANHPHGGEGEG